MSAHRRTRRRQLTSGCSGRIVEVLRLGVGVIYLLAPAEMMSADARTTVGSRVAAILGMRHIVQALVLLILPLRVLHRAGSLVDRVHAVTMIGWLLGSTRHTRLARRQAEHAAVFAVLERVAAGRR